MRVYVSCWLAWLKIVLCENILCSIPASANSRKFLELFNISASESCFPLLDCWYQRKKDEPSAYHFVQMWHMEPNNQSMVQKKFFNLKANVKLWSPPKTSPGLSDQVWKCPDSHLKCAMYCKVSSFSQSFVTVLSEHVAVNSICFH